MYGKLKKDYKMKKKQVFHMNKKWKEFRLNGIIKEARFRGANGQGINAKVSKVGPRDGGVEGNPLVDYRPKDWGVLLTRELLEAMAEKLGDFTLSTSAGLELGKSDVKMIKGTKHGSWKHKGNEVTIEYWASYR
jgi:hypothetical protein